MTAAEIFRFLFICVEVILLFNLLIFGHELGHFLAAKWRGLYIEEFALWFGKPLWRKRIGGVWYAVNSIPAGGYVKLPQMAPMESLEGEYEELPPEAKKPVGALDKIIVAFAGPFFSFLLAFLMATIVWLAGKPETKDFDAPIIGTVTANSPAEKAGLKAGDEIVSVDGKRVKNFFSGTESVKWAIIRSEGEKIPFVVRRDGETLEINSGWTKEQSGGLRRPALRQIGVLPRFAPGVKLVVRKSPADLAGLKPGDEILEVNGKGIINLDDLDPFVRDNRGKSLELVVLRDGQRVPLTLAVPAVEPGKEKEPAKLGIDWGRERLTHPDPWSQVKDSALTIFRMVGALASSNSDLKVAHFSGPVGIMRLYYQVFEAPEGWRYALALSVLINVNLGLLNLLPFPVLDGGHITLAALEAVRRKPVNHKLLEILQTACAIVLIGFMLYVTVFDVSDFFPEKRGESRAPTEEKVEK